MAEIDESLIGRLFARLADLLENITFRSKEEKGNTLNTFRFLLKTSAMLVSPKNGRKKSVTLQNDGTDEVSIGGKEVTTSGAKAGIILAKAAAAGDGSGGSITIDATDADIYALSDTAGTALIVLEEVKI